jgi:hypothetical protein
LKSAATKAHKAMRKTLAQHPSATSSMTS